MSKDSSTRYIKKLKEKIKKTPVKNIKIFQKKKKKKSHSRCMNDSEISQKTKNKS